MRIVLDARGGWFERRSRCPANRLGPRQGRVGDPRCHPLGISGRQQFEDLTVLRVVLAVRRKPGERPPQSRDCEQQIALRRWCCSYGIIRGRL